MLKSKENGAPRSFGKRRLQSLAIRQGIRAGEPAVYPSMIPLQSLSNPSFPLGPLSDCRTLAGSEQSTTLLQLSSIPLTSSAAPGFIAAFESLQSALAGFCGFAK